MVQRPLQVAQALLPVHIFLALELAKAHSQEWLCYT